MKAAIATVLVCLVAACSSEDTTPTPTSSSSSGTAGSSTSSGGASSSGHSTSGSTSSSGAATASLKAPKVDMVEKMMGALHVMWTNNETSCDTIELERQATMDTMVHEKYKVVASLPGEADNKHDTTATEDMTYTYRLRCKKGADYSPYSNEMSGNPVK